MTAPAGPAAYRVRRAEVTALQWTGSNVDEMYAFAGDDFSIDPTCDGDDKAGICASRNSAWEPLHEDYWAVRGIHGLFVVAPDVFAERYELAEPVEAPS